MPLDDQNPEDTQAPHLPSRNASSASDAWRTKMSRDVGQLKAGLAENTSATNAINDKLDATNAKLDQHMQRVQPVAIAWDNVQSGVRVLGAIGRAGDWVLQKWKPILIIIIATKVAFTGGSFSQAWQAVLKIFGKEVD